MYDVCELDVCDECFWNWCELFEFELCNAGYVYDVAMYERFSFKVSCSLFKL